MRGTRPIRLTFVQPASRETNPYGDRYWGEILRAIRDQGFDLQVINPAARRLLSRTPFSFHGVSPRLMRAVRATEPEVVLAVEYGLSTLWSIVAARFAGARVLIFQEHEGRGGKRTPGWARFVRLALLLLSDGVVANSARARADAIRTRGISPRRVYEIPLLSPPVRGARSEALEPRLKPRADVVRFLFVGRLIPQKNVLGLLQAVDILITEGKTLSLEIAGDGPLRSDMEGWVRKRALEKYVSFLGRVPYDSMPTIYEQSDVFVMPSLQEYRSVAVQEAMRFGLPVIDSMHDGNADDMIKEEENGFLVDPYDSRQLADRMSRFILNRQLISTMGRASLSRMEGITPERAAAQLRRVVSGIVS